MKDFFILKIHRLCFVLLLVTSTVGCDQSTKILARDVLPSMGSLSYLGNLIRFDYAENSGAFLSFGADLQPSLRFLIFTFAVAAFLSLLGVYIFRFRKQMDVVMAVALSLLLGGGIGNLIDRLLRGSVIDFLNVGIGDLRTGIFNVADLAIVAGVVILGLYPYLIKPKVRRPDF